MGTAHDDPDQTILDMLQCALHLDLNSATMPPLGLIRTSSRTLAHAATLPFTARSPKTDRTICLRSARPAGVQLGPYAPICDDFSRECQHNLSFFDRTQPRCGRLRCAMDDGGDIAHALVGVEPSTVETQLPHDQILADTTLETSRSSLGQSPSLICEALRASLADVSDHSQRRLEDSQLRLSGRLLH